MSLTIGIPEKKGQRFLHVWLKSTSFNKSSNYFVTCKLEAVNTPSDSNTAGRAFRTEVQKNTKQPEFKTNSFTFRLPFVASPSRTPTDLNFPNSGPHSPKKTDVDSSSIIAFVLQAFEVVNKQGSKGIARLIGTSALPLS